MTAAVLAAAALAAGCTTRVHCPTPGADARAALLLDHGRHASLAVAAADGRLVRYSYGDLRWYGRNDTGAGSAFNALLRRSPAVLSRRELAAAPTPDAVARELAVVVEHGHRLAVDARRADALLAGLDRLFFADRRAIFHNAVYNLDFAPHPVPYRASNNSNHAVAGWLRDLGCETDGGATLSRWRVTTGQED